MYKEQIINIASEKYSYNLDFKPIINRSETIVSETDTLRADIDYVLDYKNGILILNTELKSQFVRVNYLIYPDYLTESHRRYKEISIGDSLTILAPIRRPLWQLSDSNLDVSGSKTFAISLSEGSALDLRQSLYVSIKGLLSDNVNIIAQLTDSQSRLSPEGDSKDISSLDQVFIKLYGREYELAMGDIKWNSLKTKYIDYRSSFSGLSISYFDKFKGSFVYSASSGKNARQQIQIIDGKQGPYYLSANDTQSAFSIVAASEKIYLDDSLLERGTDYTISYNEGTVMFKRLVSSFDRVIVYFQYTDEYYKQNMLMNHIGFTPIKGLVVSQNMLYQRDNRLSPLLWQFTESDLDSLESAGDNEAWGDGVSEVDSGEGSYKLRYTENGLVYYEYAPADSNAIYDIIFSFVGQGQGDYDEFSSGKFVYKGIGLGSWLPQKRLIAPVSRFNVNTQFDYSIGDLRLGGEIIYTANDKNTLSVVDDRDNTSMMTYSYLEWSPLRSNIRPKISVNWEHRGSNAYLFAESTDAVDGLYDVYLSTPDSLNSDKYSSTLGLNIRNVFNPSISGLYISLGDGTKKYAWKFESFNKSTIYIPSIRAKTMYAKTEQSANEYSELDSHNYYFDYKLGIMNSAFAYTNDTDKVVNDEKTINTSTEKINPSISIGNDKTNFVSTSYLRLTNNADIGSKSIVYKSDTYSLKTLISGLKNNLYIDYNHRKINNQSDADNPKSRFDLISIRTNNNWFKDGLSLSGNYQLNQTEFFPQIRELEYIGSGLGFYDSTGVMIPNGDYDYIYITSPQGQQSSEITGQLSGYLKPGMFLSGLSRLQSDINLNAMEITSKRNDWLSYIFHPDHTFDHETSIFSKQNYQQNIWLDLISGRMTLNLNLNAERILDRRYQDLTRSNLLSNSLRMDIKNIRSNNFSIFYSNEDQSESRYTSDTNQNLVAITWNRMLSRHDAIDISLEGSQDRGRNTSSDEIYTSRSIAINPAYKISLGQKYRGNARVTLRYRDIEGQNYLSFLPDKREGFGANWALSLIYRFNSFTSVILDYSGNSYPDQSAKHQFKLEFKAEL